MDDATATILIVDDQVDNLLVLTSLLKSQGYEVRKARGGQLALQTVEAEIPDLILLDIRMPEVDGYQVCAQLKASPITQEVPIIFLSALNEIDDRMAAFAAGGADYITKPFYATEVLARIHCQLTIQRQRHQLIEQNYKLQQEIQERQRVELALREANLELERLASLDGLTQIFNRRRFDAYWFSEWQQAQHQQTSLSLIMCDVDCFKAYNDYYGHQAGDQCLYRVAQAIQQTLVQPRDLVARYGGEELAIVLPQTPAAEAVRIVNQIRAMIAQLQIVHEGSSVGLYLTASFGIWSQTPKATDTAESAILAADAALYAAKAAGRDCWKLYPVTTHRPRSVEVIPLKS
ncbi:MAG: diguanylate cyclase [Elainella sp. Prado103]|jgi:diguanylate cyclase (GGDEF)-like protein|nr:diguanylate cyclase [Elainella sp. Prado103]